MADHDELKIDLADENKIRSVQTLVDMAVDQDHDETKSRVLVIGSTGQIGHFIALSSAALLHPTFALVRPSTLSSKPHLIRSFQASGITILQGSLQDYQSLISAIKQVDIVISAVGGDQLLNQLNLISAIKEVGTVKRFLPSEFGIDVDHVHGLAPAQARFDCKVKIRRAIEEAEIPYTYVTSFAFGNYFLKNLMQPGLKSPPRDKVIIYGDGNAKAVLLSEEDIGLYTMKIVDDPRTLNKTVHLRPPANTMCQNELVEIWEGKIGKSLEKVFVSEEELVKQVEAAPYPQCLYPAYLHVIFVKGGECNFALGPRDVEAFELYPELQCTSVDQILQTYV